VEPRHRFFLAHIVTAETMQAHNTFDEPDRVRVQGYREFRRSGDHLLLVVPARSIVTLEIR
jgi:alpha-N-arabinofuranosidase